MFPQQGFPGRPPFPPGQMPPGNMPPFPPGDPRAFQSVPGFPPGGPPPNMQFASQGGYPPGPPGAPGQFYGGFPPGPGGLPPGAPGGPQAPPPAPAAAPKPTPLKVRLVGQEKPFYSSLFSIADPDSVNKIEGKQAVEFFKKSGLPVAQLRKIWEVADYQKQNYLTRDEFYIALRLIALAQNGHEPSADSIVTNLSAPLPKFENLSRKTDAVDGLPVEREEKKDVRLERAGSMDLLGGPVSSPSPSTPADSSVAQPSAPVSAAAGGMPMPGGPMPMPGGHMPMPGGVMPMPGGYPPAGPGMGYPPGGMPPGPGPVNGAEWALLPEDVTRYESIFKKSDTDLDGFVTGGEARDLFLRSNLTTDELSFIWSLSDMTNDGKLNRTEFLVAMHLIKRRKTGAPFPPVIPPEMLASIEGTSQPSASVAAPSASAAAAPAPVPDMLSFDAPVSSTPAASPPATTPVKPAPVADLMGMDDFAGLGASPAPQKSEPIKPTAPLASSPALGSSSGSTSSSAPSQPAAMNVAPPAMKSSSGSSDIYEQNRMSPAPPTAYKPPMGPGADSLQNHYEGVRRERDALLRDEQQLLSRTQGLVKEEGAWLGSLLESLSACKEETARVRALRQEEEKKLAEQREKAADARQQLQLLEMELKSLKSEINDIREKKAQVVEDRVATHEKTLVVEEQLQAAKSKQSKPEDKFGFMFSNAKPSSSPPPAQTVAAPERSPSPSPPPVAAPAPAAAPVAARSPSPSPVSAPSLSTTAAASAPKRDVSPAKAAPAAFAAFSDFGSSFSEPSFGTQEPKKPASNVAGKAHATTEKELSSGWVDVTSTTNAADAAKAAVPSHPVGSPSPATTPIPPSPAPSPVPSPTPAAAPTPAVVPAAKSGFDDNDFGDFGGAPDRANADGGGSGGQWNAPAVVHKVEETSWGGFESSADGGFGSFETGSTQNTTAGPDAAAAGFHTGFGADFGSTDWSSASPTAGFQADFGSGFGQDAGGFGAEASGSTWGAFGDSDPNGDSGFGEASAGFGGAPRTFSDDFGSFVTAPNTDGGSGGQKRSDIDLS